MHLREACRKSQIPGGVLLIISPKIADVSLLLDPARTKLLKFYAKMACQTMELAAPAILSCRWLSVTSLSRRCG